MTRREFERHIREAVEAVPEKFRGKLANVAFVLEDSVEAGLREPDADIDHCELLGLHEGHNLLEQPPDPTGTLPTKITLFRDVIEEEAEDSGEDLAVIIRETVWHEIAHHFGFDEDDAVRLERRWEEEWEKHREKAGYTLMELLVVIGIIGLLAVVAVAAVLPARARARDRLRIAQIDQMGRFLLAISCYAPASGPGDYDLKTLHADLVAANPAAAQALPSVPRDPRLGSETQSGYRYAFAADGTCVLYASLEDGAEEVTLPTLSAPTPGGGAGVLQAAAVGPNGSDRYYQIGR